MESCPSGPIAFPHRSTARVAFTALLVLLSLAFGGCQKAASHDDPVVAHDDSSFDAWVAQHTAVLTPTEARELTEARQQIRFKVMQAKTGLPKDEFEQAVYEQINGKTVREILLTSYALQIDRVTTELANYEPQLKRFETHDASQRLTDDERAYVEKSLSTLKAKMQQREDELQQLRARIDELKKSPAAAP